MNNACHTQKDDDGRPAAVTETLDPMRTPGGNVAMRWLPRGQSSVWLIGAFIIAMMVAAPIIAVAYLAFFPTENIWPHLASTMLPRYVKNTAVLMLGVGIGVTLLGVSAAWVVTMCKLPGKRFFEWAMLLPMAVPAYIVAYVYTDLLEYAGPVQRLLRGIFGWSSAADYWFPDIRTKGGAIMVLSLTLYPYVYMLARAAFLAQSICVIEAARVLGRSAWSSFVTVALPLARPAIVVGVVIALMETLNDFGTIDFFAVHTLTAGVFNVWLGMGNAGGAAQIALTMLAVVIALLLIERYSRRRQRFHDTTNRYQELPGYDLGPMAKVGALAICILPIVLGFVIPSLVLIYYSVGYFDQSWTADFFEFAGNSLLVSGLATALAVGCALFMAYALRLFPQPFLKFFVRLSSVGYAVPGAVLAIGVLIPFARFDNALDAVMRDTFGISTGLLLSGTVFALVFAYAVRFMAVSYGSIEAALGKVRPSMDDAARTLGESPWGTLKRIHFPMIRGGILAASVLVFVDGMKELPATLILRPFNFDTLATHVYQFAKDEMIEQAALGALTIVLVGVVPVIMLSRAISRSRPGHSNES
ncbi:MULTISPECIES: ABC transporter permease [Thalassospira]|uniref:Iron ABC transporter permease n=2 Tax=Thalassospira TaxID=168934 RepID=A0A367W5I7_9PROT|nr:MULTISPECIES: iron ABC transporter permease [Thalassospira]MDG4721053.1 iron ABC transporter permease [Thalassospira sp. FZY0004]RCK36708.1 iron ABC transporter permease [Thalassospira profundimaris]